MGHPLPCCIVHFVVTGYCLSSEGSVLDIPEAAADVDQKTSLKSKLQKQTCSKAYYFQANWIDPENSRQSTNIILLVREM